MSASSAVVDGLGLLNNSLGFLSTGAVAGGLENAANNTTLNPVIKAVTVTGDGLQLGATVGSMFTVGSDILTKSLLGVNALGQIGTFLADASAAAFEYKQNGSISGATARGLTGDITALAQSGLLNQIATAAAADATEVALVGGATLSMPAALGLAAVVGGVSVVLGYAGLLPDSVQSQISSEFTSLKGLFVSDTSSDAGAFNPQTSIAAPETVTVSPDGTIVTTTQYGASGINSTLVQIYTDSSRQTLVSETDSDQNLVTGQTTIKTLNYNPDGAECTFSQTTTIGTGPSQLSGSVTGTENADGSIATASISGSVASVTATNATVAVNSGASTTVSGSGNTVEGANNATFTLNGSNNNVSSGTNSVVNVQGSNNDLGYVGPGSTVALTGQNETVGTSGSTVEGANGATFTIDGSDNNVSSGTNSVVNVQGSNNDLGYVGPGSTVALTGQNETVGTSGSTVEGANGATFTLNGSNNNVSSGTGSVVNVQGSNNNLGYVGSNSTVALTGQNETVGTSGSTVEGANGATFTLDGSNNNVSSGAGSVVNVQGSNNDLGYVGSGSTVGLTGQNETVSTSGSTVEAANGATFTLNGSNNSVSSGTGSVMTMNGGNTNVSYIGSGSTVNVSGQGKQISGNNDTINCAAGFSGNVAGGSNQVNLAGTGNYLGLLGGTGNTVNNAQNSTINTWANTAFVLNGSGNSLGLGANNAVAVNGNGNTVNAGDNSVVVDNGVGNTLNVSNSVIVLGSQNIGQTIYINGSGDYIDATALANSNPLVQANIVVRGTGNTIYGNNNTKIDLTGTSGNAVVGNNIPVTTNNSNYTRGAGSAPSGVYGPLIPESSTTLNGLTTGGAPDSGTAGSGSAGSGTTYAPAIDPWYSGSSFEQAFQNGAFTMDGTGATGTGTGSGDDGELNILVTGCPDGVDPVILNLAGGTVETVGLAGSGASFDMQNNGQAVQTAWGTAGEGYLVFDPNDPDNTTAVTQDSQLVGGFGALQSLAQSFDGTGSGSLNASDALWSDLKVWVDTTGTGQFESGQLYSLSQLGITSINLDAGAVNLDSNGNEILADSTFTRADGSTGDIAGVNLMYNSGGSTTASLADVQVQNLISAMASFGAGGAAGTTVVTSSQNDATMLLAASAH